MRGRGGGGGGGGGVGSGGGDRPPPKMEHATMERAVVATPKSGRKRRPRTMKLDKSDMMQSLKLLPDAGEDPTTRAKSESSPPVPAAAAAGEEEEEKKS